VRLSASMTGQLCLAHVCGSSRL